MRARKKMLVPIYLKELKSTYSFPHKCLKRDTPLLAGIILGYVSIMYLKLRKQFGILCCENAVNRIKIKYDVYNSA